MATRHEIATETARALATADLSRFPALLGFDGFVDDIIHVVDKRHSHEKWDRLATIADFGKKIRDAAGESANFELVTLQQKLGGNGPIMANALAAMGVPVTYVGTVGDEQMAGDTVASGAAGQRIHPVFREFAARATLIPLAPPARTSALEFTDGKLMLGNLAPLMRVTWPRIVEAVKAAAPASANAVADLFEHSVLLGMLNWTMLPFLTDIWQSIAREILPRLSKKPRRFFVDMADPQKRTAADLQLALQTLLEVNATAPVTLGLNLAEALQVARVLDVAIPAEPERGIRELAAAIRAKLPLDTIVIHPRKGAAAADATGSAEFSGPFTARPKISTGAGDHFNAGFALGQLLGLPLSHALCLGTATSGYYVRHATSPPATELARFLENLPDAE